MDFDIIIYVLIGIVWIVISIVQANQKAKQSKLKKQAQADAAKNKQQSQQPMQNAENSHTASTKEITQPESIENWLAELLNVEKQQTQPAPEYNYEPAEVAEESEKVIETEIIDTIGEEGDSAVLSEIQLNEISDKNTYREASEIAGEFEIRKAIIFSEILKRPYN